MAYNSNNLKTQNELLMSNLMDFYNSNDTKQKNSNFVKMMNVVNGESKISLRIIDWFVTNYSKKNFLRLMRMAMRLRLRLEWLIQEILGRFAEPNFFVASW